MSTSNAEYFRARAAEEREKASQSRRADVAAIHLDLARQYEALAEENSGRSRQGLPSPAWTGRRRPALDLLRHRAT